MYYKAALLAEDYLQQFQPPATQCMLTFSAITYYWLKAVNHPANSGSLQ